MYLDFALPHCKNRTIMYKEGNNYPSSVNLKSLDHKHNKIGNKCHTETRENPSEWILVGTREKLTSSALPTHPSCYQEHNQSYMLMSNQVSVTQINKALGQRGVF